jgi:hypothetical protein
MFNKLEDSMIPILFVLDSSYIAQHIFIPVTIMAELTDSYHEFILSEIFMINQKTTGDLVEINIEKSLYDFGELELNDSVETIFEIQNISSSPLKITNIKPDCGCTVVEWDRKPTISEEKALIKVQYNAEKTGFFAKKIYVFSNALNSPHALIIKGKVNN